MRGMRAWILAVAVFSFAGCRGDEVKSATHHLSWKPPRGVTLTADTATGLQFSGGVKVTSIPGAPGPLPEEGGLDALLLTVLKASGDEPLDKRISGRLGDVPAGKVARWVLSGGGQRALHYYLPLKDRALVISMVTPEAAFGTRESQLDLSLSTLKIE